MGPNFPSIEQIYFLEDWGERILFIDKISVTCYFFNFDINRYIV